MRHLQPVLWTKGLFLTPQHLQSQDRYLESLLQFQVDSLNRAPWGFRQLSIDHKALETGVFSLTEASGIMPDGLLFDIPASDAAPPPRPFAAAFTSARQSLDIYLAVPHYRDHGKNVSAEQKTAETRYHSEVCMVRDEMSGLVEKPIQVARKNLRFLVEGESREGSASLCVARVIRAGSGAFALDERFIPPALDLGASPYLTTILRRLVEILSAKSTELSALRRQKNKSLADFTASDIANFWLLYTVNSHLPLFRHIFEVRRGHPQELFALMLSTAGALTAFSSEVHPRDFPGYDHDNLGPCFTQLDQTIRDLLETVVPKNFVSLPLKQVQNAIYATPLAEDRYFDRTRMYLAIRADMNKGDLIGRTPHLVKLCSATHIEHLVQKALPGVELTHVARPPSALPVKLQFEYFILNQSGVAWEAIARARNLAAYVPAEFPSPELELIILLPEPAGKP